jgi:hypothetical protein
MIKQIVLVVLRTAPHMLGKYSTIESQYLNFKKCVLHTNLSLIILTLGKCINILHKNNLP